ncbi:MAG: SET domain-containing protein-lysine N-methyltransferase [Spirochaetales bacterium]|nr:MAG: SET domain-containing protein-lysine N-methyltransferase [Spirochaetales bacterium]
MTPEGFRTFFQSLGIEYLSANKYVPFRLGERDVRRTPYYRRNKDEFELLALRYSSFLDNPEKLPELEVRTIGGLLGRGLFSLNAVPAGNLVGEYTGIVQPARKGRALKDGGFSSDYSWGFPKVSFPGRALEIDARLAGGPLRFVNHGINPNTEVEHFVSDGRWRIVFTAVKSIQPGDELTVDYGPAYWCGGSREMVVNYSS